MSLPTWDETIVPALRKRLESESRLIAKRMSIASVSSLEKIDFAPKHVAKSSAIPRPRRTRTYSQPPSPPCTNNPLPTPDSSRPTSPRSSDVRPTRIPVATRARTASSSSHAHSIAQRADSRNGTNHRPYQPPTPDTSQDHRKPCDPLTSSIRHPPSSIINEPPPFPTPSFASSLRSRTQDHIQPDTRPSNDSDERPFEHWYRGDVHRNGGVGEFRVAKHVEMLQIANYGHTLRTGTAPRRSPDLSPHLDAIRRRRADSVDVGTHDSPSMVPDETPPTDIELDPDIDAETFYDAYTTADPDPDTAEPAPAPSARSQTPTRTHPLPDVDATPKHPTHAHATSDSLRYVTPSAPLRTSSEYTMPTRARSASRTTSPTSQSSDQSHTKRRAKSPAASSPASTPKKARTKVKTPPSASRREDPRNSIATYPTPEGDMVNAIPTWTQPIQKSGNWDEVVLPVVARKRGLDGQYEQADGSPRPRLPASPLVKPAPGTFGYDYTKYRPTRLDEEMQLHEFGQNHSLPEEDPIPPPAQTLSKPPIPQLVIPEPIRQDPRLTVPRPPDSPAPFAHYHSMDQLPTINVTRPSIEVVDRRQEQEHEDVSGGCCKCVIM